MKIGIVGAGFVGSSAAYALIMRGVGREIVLVDKNEKRAIAEAEDLFHAVPFANPLIVDYGDYADLKDSRAVIMAAGVNQKPGETRMQLLARNATVFREVIPQILAHAPDAVLIVATNPVDVMTHFSAAIAAEHGVPVGRVFGSGTTLDTARFRALLSQRLDVDPAHIHAYVLGEHGDSEVLAWSNVTIGGLSLEEYSDQAHISLSEQDRNEIDMRVRRAAYRIIEGKGATYYGIGSALAQIIDIVLHDQRAIMTVCAPQDDVFGVQNVTIALPILINGNGVERTLPIHLETDEAEKLRASAAIVKAAIDELHQK